MNVKKTEEGMDSRNTSFSVSPTVLNHTSEFIEVGRGVSQTTHEYIYSAWAQ